MAERKINPVEWSMYLGVLMSAAFDPTSRVLNLARSAEILNKKAGGKRFNARTGLRHLLDIAYTLTDETRDISAAKRASMILEWVQTWVQSEDWKRIQAQVRKRRQYEREKVRAYA